MLKKQGLAFSAGCLDLRTHESQPLRFGNNPRQAGQAPFEFLPTSDCLAYRFIGSTSRRGAYTLAPRRSGEQATIAHKRRCGTPTRRSRCLAG